MVYSKRRGTKLLDDFMSVASTAVVIISSLSLVLFVAVFHHSCGVLCVFLLMPSFWESKTIGFLHVLGAVTMGTKYCNPVSGIIIVFHFGSI